MKVMMRLYRQHDLDLICLYKTNGFSFQKAMKIILKAYVNQEPCSIKIPSTLNVAQLPKSVRLHICLSEDKDADIIKWLNSIARGYRNSLLKNMFRGYMESPILVPYYGDVHNNIETKIFKADTSSVEDMKKMVNEILDTPINKEKSLDNTKNITLSINNSNEDDEDFLGSFDDMLNDF